MGSYSIRSNQYTSHLTGRSYPFVRTRDGAAKKAALAKMYADDKAYADARKSRPDKPPERLTHEQKVAAVVHAPKGETNVADSIGTRIAILERQLSHTRNAGDRASIQRKINALGGRQEIEIQRQEVQAAQQAFEQSPEWTQANADAFAVAEQLALRADPDLPESLVRDAIESKELLRRQPTPEGIAAYREREAKLQEAYQAGRLRSIELSKARIAQAEMNVRLAILDASPTLPSEQMAETAAETPAEYR